MYLVWPGNASGSPRRNWRVWLGRRKSGGPCLAGCHHDPAPDKRMKMDGWMDGKGVQIVNTYKYLGTVTLNSSSMPPPPFSDFMSYLPPGTPQTSGLPGPCPVRGPPSPSPPFGRGATRNHRLISRRRCRPSPMPRRGRRCPPRPPSMSASPGSYQPSPYPVPSYHHHHQQQHPPPFPPPTFSPGYSPGGGPVRAGSNRTRTSGTGASTSMISRRTAGGLHIATTTMPTGSRRATGTVEAVAETEPRWSSSGSVRTGRYQSDYERGRSPPRHRSRERSSYSDSST